MKWEDVVYGALAVVVFVVGCWIMPRRGYGRGVGCVVRTQRKDVDETPPLVGGVVSRQARSFPLKATPKEVAMARVVRRSERWWMLKFEEKVIVEEVLDDGYLYDQEDLDLFYSAVGKMTGRDAERLREVESGAAGRREGRKGESERGSAAGSATVIDRRYKGNRRQNRGRWR